MLYNVIVLKNCLIYFILYFIIYLVIFFKIIIIYNLCNFLFRVVKLMSVAALV